MALKDISQASIRKTDRKGDPIDPSRTCRAASRLGIISGCSRLRKRAAVPSMWTSRWRTARPYTRHSIAAGSDVVHVEPGGRCRQMTNLGSSCVNWTNRRSIGSSASQIQTQIRKRSLRASSPLAPLVWR
jgi:hypothetical protein